MEQSIFRNPKIDNIIFTLFGEKDGFFTDSWRKRCIEFYETAIPSHISKDNQLFLTTPNDFMSFIKKTKYSDDDISHIEYLCIVEPIADLYDIIEFFTLLLDKLPDHAKVLYTNFNWQWSPLFRISGLLGISRNRPFGNYYRIKDMNCFLEMSGWENVKNIRRYILPVNIPLISTILDDFLVRLPLLNFLAANTFFVARKSSEITYEDCSTTVLIPCKNEEENIEAAAKRMPEFGKSIEIVFINDQSTDATEQKILQCKNEFPEKNIILAQGKGKGKGEAIREGMKKATGDICMILDADLTIIPEDLPQFYLAMKNRRADFIHGSRMVYSQTKEAMRFANIVGNQFFSAVFSYLLEERTTDTLCGTKVFWRRDWPLFEEMRLIFGKTDVWGDYNLIFGASRFGLKIAQLPVRYFDRLEGLTKMNKRLKNGLIMLKVSWLALWKVRFFH